MINMQKCRELLTDLLLSLNLTGQGYNRAGEGNSDG